MKLNTERLKYYQSPYMEYYTQISYSTSLESVYDPEDFYSESVSEVFSAMPSFANRTSMKKYSSRGDFRRKYDVVLAVQKCSTCTADLIINQYKKNKIIKRGV